LDHGHVVQLEILADLPARGVADDHVEVGAVLVADADEVGVAPRLHLDHVRAVLNQASGRPAAGGQADFVDGRVKLAGDQGGSLGVPGGGGSGEQGQARGGG